MYAAAARFCACFLFAGLLAQAEQGLYDEVNLLQAEVSIQSGRAGEARRHQEQQQKHQPAKEQESFCSQLSAEGCSASELLHRGIADIIDEADGGQLPADEFSATTATTPAQPPLPAPGADNEVGSLLLRYGLQILIIAIVADGIHRARSAKAEEPVAAFEDPAAASASPELLQAALAVDLARCEELLTQEDADVGADDVWGCTALHAAAAASGAAGADGAHLVKRLLQKRAQVDVCDAWDETPLHLAARKGATETCELLLAYGAQINAANMQDWTPLAVAAKEGHGDTYRFLLGRGAEPGALDEEQLAAWINGEE